MARLSGFEPEASGLGELPKSCHECSSMYRKVFIFLAFLAFRIAPCSSMFTLFVRRIRGHISHFLANAKKELLKVFYLSPILADLGPKVHLRGLCGPNRHEFRNSYRTLTELFLGACFLDKRIEHCAQDLHPNYNTLYVSAHSRMGLFYCLCQRF